MFLFKNNVDLKNNRNYRTPYSGFFGCANSYIKFCFQPISINNKITYDTVMKRHLRPCCPLLREQCPFHVTALRGPRSGWCLDQTPSFKAKVLNYKNNKQAFVKRCQCFGHIHVWKSRQPFFCSSLFLMKNNNILWYLGGTDFRLSKPNFPTPLSKFLTIPLPATDRTLSA